MIGWMFYTQFGYSERQARALDNVARVRNGLRDIRRETRTPSRIVVRLECFNQSEADDVRALLTDDEKSHVLFSWLFGNGASPERQEGE